MHGHGRNCGLLVLLAGMVMFTNLGVPPLWDRDEPRNAGCAREMLSRGDWVVPIFNDELRTHKPVLLYWVMMAAYRLFGEGEFAARCGSALAAVGTVLLTYETGRHMFGRSAATWAGVVLSTTLMFGVAGRAATPDALLIFFCTLAITLFVRAVFGDQRQAARPTHFPSSIPVVVAIYAAMGLAVLAKGPVGFVLPTAVIGMYLLIARLPPQPPPVNWWSWLVFVLRPFAPLHFLRTCWLMRPVTAIVTIAAVSLPWYAWVTWRTDGAWTRGFFWEHNVGRAMQVSEGHSGPAVLFYVVAMLVGFFPWSVLTIPTGCHVVKGISKEAPIQQRLAATFLLGWVGVFVGLFSLAQTKLPSYITPCYPALAILIGWLIHSWRTTETSPAWLRFGLGWLFGVGVVLAIGLSVAAWWFLDGSQWLGIVGVTLAVGAAACWYSNLRLGAAATSSTFTATAICFSFFMTAILPAEVGHYQKYHELLQDLAGHDGPVVAFGHLEPSWVFYSGRPIREFGAHEPESLAQFLAGQPPAMVITSAPRLKLLEDNSALSFERVASTDYFLRDRELLLLRCAVDDGIRVAGRPPVRD